MNPLITALQNITEQEAVAIAIDLCELVEQQSTENPLVINPYTIYIDEKNIEVLDVTEYQEINTYRDLENENDQVFSIGMVLYELLSKTPSETAEQRTQKKAQGKVHTLPDLSLSIEHAWELDDIISESTTLNKSERCTLSVLKEQLEEIYQEYEREAREKERKKVLHPHDQIYKLFNEIASDTVTAQLESAIMETVAENLEQDPLHTRYDLLTKKQVEAIQSLEQKAKNTVYTKIGSIALHVIGSGAAAVATYMMLTMPPTAETIEQTTTLLLSGAGSYLLGNVSQATNEFLASTSEREVKQPMVQEALKQLQTNLAKQQKRNTLQGMLSYFPPPTHKDIVYARQQFIDENATAQKLRTMRHTSQATSLLGVIGMSVPAIVSLAHYQQTGTGLPIDGVGMAIGITVFFGGASLYAEQTTEHLRKCLAETKDNIAHWKGTKAYQRILSYVDLLRKEQEQLREREKAQKRAL